MNRRWGLIAAGLMASRLAWAQPDPTAEPPKPVITIGGYLETHYQLNFRKPSNGLTAFRGFDNRDRTFTLANVALDVKAERGPLTVRTVFQVGTTGSTYYLAEPARVGGNGVNATGSELWKYVQTATLAYKAPKDLLVEAGLFLSPIGPEVMPIKDNWSYSRSNLFFGLPFYHTGARVSRPLGGGWVGTVALYSGWNSVVDNNTTPSIALSALYTSSKVTAQALYFGGNERAIGAPEGRSWRHLFDAYAQVALTEQLSLIAHGNAGAEPTDFGTSGWAAAQLHAKYQLSRTLYAALRGDYFREWVADDNGMTATPIFWPTEWMSSGTATLALQPVDGLSIRLEYRHDEAKGNVFFDGDVAGDGVTMPFVPTSKRQDTITLGAVAWF